MPILAFDTCYGACSAAVLTADGSVLAAAFEPMRQGHAERLLPMIGEVMAAASVGFGDLEALAVTVGPGSFTGVRIGIAAARGLALARDLPLRGTSSLAVMAAVARDRLAPAERGLPLAVAVDARRGEMHVLAAPMGNPAGFGAPLLLTATAAAASVSAGDVVAVGSGAPMLAEAARLDHGRAVSVRLTDLEPDAAWLGRVPLHALSPPTPLYLRPADAKVPAAPALARRP